MAAKLRIIVLIALAALAALTSAPTPARAALTTNAELALDRGLHHLYSLDYREARSDFRKLIEQEPDNPFGYLFESGAIWWQSSQEYGLFKDTPTLQGLFEQDVEFAIKKADPLTDSKDKAVKADGHFVEGMALGTRGQWSLMRGHYMKAFFDAKKAIKHLKKVPKIDASYRDVDLGLGVFDYQAAHASGLARLSGVLGLRGDEKRGLEELRSAMDHGHYATRQAAEFLVTIYIMDKQDWAQALPVVQKMRQEFPESPYYASLELLVRWKLGQKEESLKLGPALFDMAKADPTRFNRKLLSMVCGLMGEECLGKAQASAMRDWLTAAIDAAPAPKPAPKTAGTRKGAKAAPPAGAAGSADAERYLSTLHLYRGYMNDALGKTDEGAADYDWTLKHAEFADSRSRAQECQENGCPAKDLLLYLRSISREDSGEKP